MATRCLKTGFYAAVAMIVWQRHYQLAWELIEHRRVAVATASNFSTPMKVSPKGAADSTTVSPPIVFDPAFTPIHQFPAKNVNNFQKCPPLLIQEYAR